MTGPFPFHGLTTTQAEFVRRIAGGCQNTGCANTTELRVDHDHLTGVLRGVLCNTCNSSLGRVKDDIEKLQVKVERLQGLIRYLEDPPIKGVKLPSIKPVRKLDLQFIEEIELELRNDEPDEE